MAAPDLLPFAGLPAAPKANVRLTCAPGTDSSSLPTGWRCAIAARRKPRRAIFRAACRWVTYWVSRLVGLLPINNLIFPPAWLPGSLGVVVG